ncbi:hypothetical protein BDV23DRAFT_171574 [Aspergillus alliaceus]|uniref:BTB domain-containing protein n=1 Tax=Petromyces alliaceus TaxID=209559 RepID=A0A5N7CBY7_PETAA|nr:hypothetical protein BDV23DRAFT_171574 [Aspergillus alliaceus]
MSFYCLVTSQHDADLHIMINCGGSCNSDVVQFCVGKDQKRFSIYQKLESSFPRKALEPAMIKDIDEEIFGRCCEYVYSGDSSSPSCGPRNTMPPRCEKKWDPSNLDWNLFHPNGLSRNYEILLAELGHTPQPGAEKDLSNDPNTSYAAVFLSHAEIHRFAARTGWLSLDLLSLYRLLRLLETVTLFEERTGDIVQTWEKMLCDYMVWNVEMLMHNAEFKSFLERNPPLENIVFRSMWD